MWQKLSRFLGAALFCRHQRTVKSVARHPQLVPISCACRCHDVRINSSGTTLAVGKLTACVFSERRRFRPPGQPMAQMSASIVEQPECTTLSIQSDLVQRGIAAGLASAFSSVAMNPLDVVKVSKRNL